MNEINKVIFLCVLIVITVSAVLTIQNNSLQFKRLWQQKGAHLSPEIMNELKDFKDLIPSATVVEIISKHYLVDGNFRTALKYLRSQEFTQLQKQLLNVPEIIDVLEFLHLTTANATTRHMGATKMPAIATRVRASLDEYYDDAVANDKMTTNTDTSNSQAEIVNIENVKEALNNLRLSRLPQQQQQQFHMHEDNNKNNNNNNNKNQYVGINDNNDDEAANANSFASNAQQPLMQIVLLQDLEVNAQGYHQPHHHKYNRQDYNRYQHYSSLGTFTTFVEDVLQHLPNAAYQNMIKDKCSKNPKFAQFYQALRSAELKPLIAQVKSTSNIKNIIATLNSHDVDVDSLEPIAFQVISWGPNV